MKFMLESEADYMRLLDQLSKVSIIMMLCKTSVKNMNPAWSEYECYYSPLDGKLVHHRIPSMK